MGRGNLSVRFVLGADAITGDIVERYAPQAMERVFEQS